MSSLSQFSKNFRKNTGNSSQEKTQGFDEQKELKTKIENTYQSYQNMNSDQLMEQLISEGKRLKRNGQFDYNALANAIKSMDGMISEEQKNNMLRLLNQIK